MRSYDFKNVYDAGAEAAQAADDCTTAIIQSASAPRWNLMATTVAMDDLRSTAEQCMRAADAVEQLARETYELARVARTAARSARTYGRLARAAARAALDAEAALLEREGQA